MNCSIWHIDGTQTGTTIRGQSGPRSNGNEGVLHIPQTPGVLHIPQTPQTASLSGTV